MVFVGWVKLTGLTDCMMRW
uniref:Uncharacterized protein n=1 Tax=Arundo donax TaxID=35708 RepID=A0A0A9C5U0_ARUDO